MGSGPGDTLVICVSPGVNGRWDVSEKGFEAPIASFDDRKDAYAYATGLAETKPGGTALLEEKDGSTLVPKLSGNGDADGLQFSSSGCD